MIRCESLCKHFDNGMERLNALNNITLHVKQGECVVLQGASGSGKSTLLSVIAGIAKPTSGQIIVNDLAIAKLPEAKSAAFRRETLGFIFQKFHLIPTLSVYDNIAVPLIPMKLSAHDVRARIDAAMQRSAIAHKAHHLVRLLSGGEQQRVAIARALVTSPKIILADEPTANLDARLANDLCEHFATLKASGMTLLIATHDPLFSMQPWVDTIYTMHLGECSHES